MSKLENDVRFLKYCVGVLTFACAVLIGLVVKLYNPRKFEEIDVERINVVEADGSLRMVISNKQRQHPGSMDGVDYKERQGERPPGMMFFGENGNEIGGLVFDSSRENGQGGSLTFDKFRSDQTVQFIHDEKPDGSYFAGLKMSDQNLPLNDLVSKQKEIAKLPSKQEQEAAWQSLRNQGLLSTERLKIGKDSDKSSLIQLKDTSGKVRIELKVSADGSAKLNFLDEHSNVIYSLPPATVEKASKAN